MKEIEFTVSPDGTIEIDQMGFEGKQCDDVANMLVKALGKVIKQTKKTEYYKPVIHQKAHQVQKF